MPLDLRRRRDVGTILLDALRLLREHAPVFLVATAVVVAPVRILVDGVLGGQLADGPDATPPLGGQLLSLLLGAWVVPALVTALHVRAVQGLGEGVDPTVRGVLRQAAHLLPRVLPVIVLSTLVVALGLVLLVVPGVYLSVRYYLAAQAAVVDGARGADALEVSGRLTDGSWWRVFRVLLLLGLVAGVIGYVIGAGLGGLVASLTDSGVLFVLLSILGQTIAMSISALGGTLLFFDLRGQQGVAHALGGFLPPSAG